MPRGSIVVFLGVVAACSSFGSADDIDVPDRDGGTSADGGSDATATSDGGTGDAGEDGSACKGGRPGPTGNMCKDTACAKGDTCCLSTTPTCTGVNDCGTVQVNCVSPDGCDPGKVCCQVVGTGLGTRCSDSCAFGAPLCVSDLDCKAGEYCREPDPSEQIAYWHCAPCAP